MNEPFDQEQEIKSFFPTITEEWELITAGQAADFGEAMFAKGRLAGAAEQREKDAQIADADDGDYDYTTAKDIVEDIREAKS